jgi:hypothetical protein
MHFDSEAEMNSPTGDLVRKRVAHYWFYDHITGRSRWARCMKLLTSKIADVILPKPQQIPNLWAGWQWFSWHRSVADYVLGYEEVHPEYFDRFRYTRACDELVFHTLLSGKCEELNIDRNNALRYIEWHPKREYTSLPLVLDKREYQDIIDSGAIFCRKVHPVESAELIQLLNDKIVSDN